MLLDSDRLIHKIKSMCLQSLHSSGERRQETINCIVSHDDECYEIETQNRTIRHGAVSEGFLHKGIPK